MPSLTSRSARCWSRSAWLESRPSTGWDRRRAQRQIVALVALGVEDEGFLVNNVAVDPSHQGIGVGKTLLEQAEIAAREAGFDSIYPYTHVLMSENLAMYSRAGYVEYDRRVHDDTRLVYLRKDLG